MTQFGNTFTRNQKENLRYDDNAFMHFLAALLSIVLLYNLYVLLSQIFNPFKEQKWLKEALKDGWFNQKYRSQVKSRFKPGMLIRLIFIAAMGVGLYFLAVQLGKSDDKLIGFDPYQILEVEMGAPIQKIKKSYKKLAIKYHPDKNKGDPASVAKFIQISKAYQCFNSEEQLQKCLTFGNSQGNTATNVGIALPQFLVRKQNQVPVMILTLFCLVVVIPLLIYSGTRGIIQYNSAGLNTNNQNHIKALLSQNITYETVSKTLSLSVEFQDQRIRTTKLYDQLLKELSAQDKNIHKEINQLPNCAKKVYILLTAHMVGQPVKGDLKLEQNKLIQTSIKILEGIIKYAVMNSCKFVMPPGSRFMGRNCVDVLIYYRQSLMQGLSEKEDQLFQLKFKDQDLYTLQRKKKNFDFRKILTDAKEQEKMFAVIPSDKQNLERQIARFPVYDFSVKIALSQDQNQSSVQDLTERDFPKFIITVTRSNLSPAAHSNNTDFLFQESVHVYAFLNTSIIYYNQIFFQPGALQHKLVYNSRPFAPGAMRAGFAIRSNSYKGLDVQKMLQFKVSSFKDIKRQIFVHPEDKRMQRPKGLLQAYKDESFKDSDQELSSGDQQGN